MNSQLASRLSRRGVFSVHCTYSCQTTSTRHYATAQSNFQQWRAKAQQQGGAIMATPSKIHLTIQDTGFYKLRDQTQETATRTSELLQENHDNHHIFFNVDGFHNHIAHHLLTLFALGAPTSVIERHYKDNASYQRPTPRVREQNVQDMSDPDKFKKYLGKGDRYHDFLVFFQKEMETKGWEQTLKEYVFSGTPVAEDFMVRMFGGFLHPIIHLGFGVEFNQPAIIAEALAMAAVHQNWLTEFFVECEKAASSSSFNKTLPELLADIRNDSKLTLAAHWEDGNKIRDGILKRAPAEAIKYASQWRVNPEDLARKTAEMYNAAVYFTACAQRPPKEVRFDFYYMHCVNASVFWPAFNKLSFLTMEQKARLLEWKGRSDLVMYASRRSPELLLKEVSVYEPKLLEAGDAEWNGLFQRSFVPGDDGHAVKLVRAVAVGEKVCGEFEKEWEEGKIRGFMWLKVGNMVVDSIEREGTTWARSVGFDEAWTEYKDRATHARM